MKDPAKMSIRELRQEVVAQRLVIKRLQEDKRMAYKQGWHACGNAVIYQVKKEIAK